MLRKMIIASAALLLSAQVPAADVSAGLRYAARSSFDRIWSQTSLFRNGIELCYFDTGRLDGCNDGGSGNGWDMEYGAGEITKEGPGSYIRSVSVVHGVVIITTRNIEFNGEDSFTEIQVPELNEEKKLDWTVWPGSSCAKAGIC
jgi:hypothetical protein